MKDAKTDVLIVGGGTGGCAAAMAAVAMGCRVILTEPTHWLGGQLTSQAVPPDEHPWIETCGCTARYRRFRNGVRDFCRTEYPLRPSSRQDPLLNPGAGKVSRLCHEPRAALASIQAMLAPAIADGRLTVLRQHEPLRVDADSHRVRSVTLRSLLTGDEVTITADYVLDATELGDLLPLAGVAYVSGAESRGDTNEPHAVAGAAQPNNVQSLTWCFPMAFDPTPGANHVMAKPKQYERWRDYVPALTPPWTGPLISWDGTHPITLQPRTFELFGDEHKGFSSLWHYRRIRAAKHYDQTNPPHEVTLINWPQNDYLQGNLIDASPADMARYLDEAKQLSLALAYWLQTEADGGHPGLYLCPNIVGTDDGLAMAPYIRESRRIRAVHTITENHIGAQARGGRPAETFFDSIGIGSYRIDLHPSTGGDNYIDIATLPFQISLGSLIPVAMENFLPACKNLGVTHISNGCYRLHPVEWNIGEAAGLLAGYCIKHRTQPHALRADANQLADFQRLMVDQGFELAWPQAVIDEALQGLS